MVSYCTESLIVDHARKFVEEPLAHGVTLAIADNSPVGSNECQKIAQASNGRLHYHHYADNPLYLGAARRVIEDLAATGGGPLPYRAVVLCNADLSFEYPALVATVQQTQVRTGDYRWILAPKIVEAGRRYLPNPHLIERPRSRDRRALMQWYPSWFLYRWLYQWRRRLATNKRAGAAPFTKMYAAYGAFVVFGCGFFTAGGVFHTGPLFGEEHGIAEQARLLEVPTLYAPMLTVHHVAEASTSMRRVGARKRYTWHRTSQDFYANWDPADAQGTMKAVFEQC